MHVALGAGQADDTCAPMSISIRKRFLRKPIIASQILNASIRRVHINKYMHCCCVQAERPDLDGITNNLAYTDKPCFMLPTQAARPPSCRKPALGGVSHIVNQPPYIYLQAVTPASHPHRPPTFLPKAWHQLETPTYPTNRIADICAPE